MLFGCRLNLWVSRGCGRYIIVSISIPVFKWQFHFSKSTMIHHQTQGLGTNGTTLKTVWAESQSSLNHELTIWNLADYRNSNHLHWQDTPEETKAQRPATAVREEPHNFRRITRLYKRLQEVHQFALVDDLKLRSIESRRRSFPHAFTSLWNGLPSVHLV